MDGHGWLFNAMVFLTAAVVAAPISKRLGFGSVLGFLLAGLVIGPWGLKLISDVESILHFGEFGVVLLLFLIGLELEPRKLWNMRRQLLGTGGVQVFSSALIIGAVAWYFLDSWQSAVVIGCVLALSSTAIALQIMQERNMMSTPVGRTGFSVLLFQDLAVIPMLALFPLLGSGGDEGGPPAYQSIAIAVLAIAVVIAIGKFAIRQVFRWIANTRQREIFTAFSLFLVVGMAFLMDSIGLSMALGSFLAGVLLADSEYRHALESDIEPFKGLLMGLFFLAVGMLVDVGILIDHWPMILAIAISLMVAKGIVLLAMAPMAGLSGGDRLTFALLLSQGGEFAFVLFGAVTSEGLLSSDLIQKLSLSVAISMILTPVILFAYDRWSAKRVTEEEPPPMDTIDDGEHPVLIAGFGRFGQVIARFLHAHQLDTTIIDSNPDHIERVRKFGYKAYYGDARRMDILEAAGIKHARLLILALDDRDVLVDVAEEVKSRYPDVRILARAFDRPHAFRLLDVGVEDFVRDTFFSALRMGEEALKVFGYKAEVAERASRAMALHDRGLLFEMYKVRSDENRMISVAVESREALQFTLEGDIDDKRFTDACEQDIEDVSRDGEKPAGVPDRPLTQT